MNWTCVTLSCNGLALASRVSYRDLDSRQSFCPLPYFVCILFSPFPMLVPEHVLVVTIDSLTFIIIYLHLFASHTIAWHDHIASMAYIHLAFDAYMSHTIEQNDFRKIDSLGHIVGA